MSDRRPIGVFDSGIGGLTVLKEIKKLLPDETLLYLGDTARVPYGAKSRETVIRYSTNILDFLLAQDVKMVVVACNTASAYAIDELAEHSSRPVIGVVEGGVTAAIKKSAGGHIGIIGTEATINSGAYREALKAIYPTIEVMEKACPLFVALVEEGWTDNDIALATAHEYLGFMKDKIDTLVLGCTHYPMLKNTIRLVLGSDVKLIDSAEETANLVARRLDENKMRSDVTNDSVKLMVTDSPERSRKIGRRLLGPYINVDEVKLVDILDKKI